MTEPIEEQKPYLDLFDNLFGSDSLVVVVLDSELVIVDLNTKAQSSLGYTKDEAVGKNWAELVIPADQRDTLTSIWRDSLSSNAAAVIEGTQVHRKSGEAKSLDWIVIHNQTGPGIVHICAGIDVSEHSFLDAQQSKWSSIFAAMVNSAQDAIVLYKINPLKPLYVNNRFSEIFGYSQEEALNLGLDDLRPESDKQRSSEATERRLKGELEYERFVPLQRKNGDVFHGDITSQKLLINNETYFLINIRDTSSQKLGIEQLEQKKKELSEVQEIAHIGDFELDLESNTFQWSDEVFHIFGVALNSIVPTMDYVLGQTLVEDKEKLTVSINEAVSTKAPASFVVRINSADSKFKILTFTIKAIVENGLARRVIGLIQDSTQIMKAQEEMNYRVNLVETITTIIKEFINISPESQDAKITETLAAIGKLTDVDRSYLFRFSDDRKYFSNTHEWVNTNIEPQMQRLQNLSTEEYKWLVGVLEKDDFFAANTKDLPDEAAYLKQELEKEDIKSILLVRMFYHDKVVGFLGLDSVRYESQWAEEEINLLKIVAEVFISVIQRKSIEENFRNSNRELKRLNEIMIGREMKMVQLKKEILKLKQLIKEVPNA